MFDSRVSVVGASLVCSVDITMWPVCAALIAMSAVSRSRISPTMMMSGILAQERLQRDREVQPGLVVDVDLVDAGQVDFRRVLDRGDVHARLVQDVQAGVERHRLAAAGRAGDEHHAVRPLDRLQQPVLLDLLVAERLDADLGARRIEDPDHDLLAEQRRQGADPEVDRLVAELQLHAAVLRHALLGDVEAGDDLDARRQLVLDRERRLRDLAQLAVDAEAHAVVVLVGLEVQVGGAQR